MEKNKIHKLDTIEGLKQLDDKSVDIIISDPPYNIGKDFGNDSDSQDMTAYVNWCVEWLREYERVLKDTGTCYIYGFSEILAHISVNCKLPHRWLIWHYTNKSTAKYTFWQRSHESIITFWGKDRIFNGDLVREPYTEGFLEGSAGKSRTATEGRMGSGKDTVYEAHPLGAAGRDVIKVPALAGGAGSVERIFYCNDCHDVFVGNKKDHREHNIEEHPTQKPKELTKKLINAAKPQGECFVVVPFAGSGSECLVCEEENVDWVAFEINEQFVERGNQMIQKYRPAYKDLFS